MGADSRGFDGGKKINGRKRHLVVDCLGLLLAVMVTAASVTDRDAANALLPRTRARYFRLKLLWADGSYSAALVEWDAAALKLVLEVVKRAENTVGFTVVPRRWVIERTNGWLRHSATPKRTTSASGIARSMYCCRTARRSVSTAATFSSVRRGRPTGVRQLKVVLEERVVGQDRLVDAHRQLRPQGLRTDTTSRRAALAGEHRPNASRTRHPFQILGTQN